MEAFCELFFDNLATLLGVTGSAVGHIGFGLINASWRDWIPDLYKLHIALEWEKIYYEVRVAPAPRHPSPGGGWLAPFQISRGTRARTSDLARARRVVADIVFRLPRFFFSPTPLVLTNPFAPAFAVRLTPSPFRTPRSPPLFFPARSGTSPRAASASSSVTCGSRGLRRVSRRRRTASTSPRSLTA